MVLPVVTDEKQLAFDKARELLLKIRKEGVGKNDGHNLWVFVNKWERSGEKIEELGTTKDEVKKYVLADIGSWIRDFEQTSEITDELRMDALELEVYVADPLGRYPFTFEELGVSQEQLSVLIEKVLGRKLRLSEAISRSF